MTNRLAGSTSPYLRQHADNPVDWYPWSDEALELARREDKPIFLSIGYSACHWCHVMAHESFENPEIAEFLNRHFVNIKVDREERPDLDHIYMNAMLAMRGGGGGWPLSVFLTPDGKPFFGGTYWPPKPRMNMPGFDQVLRSVLDAWNQRRDQIKQQSSQVSQWLVESTRATRGDDVQTAWLASIVDWLDRNFDSRHGGFGSAPKFPHAIDLLLLIQLSDAPPAETDVSGEQMLEMAGTTLRAMAYGGIHDHLGGGFARYSVDEFWLVPHFEKMLYDNALLARAYLEMHRTTGDAFYAMVATKTLDYLLRDLSDPQGGFYSAEDADSEGEEGKFYVWTRDEVLDVLGQGTGALFCELYHVTPHGNFEGKNILHMTRSYQEFADQRGIDKGELREIMRRARAQLLEARNQRVRPSRDEKILVSWNALAISALAATAWTLDADRAQGYLERAGSAATFVVNQMRRDDGRLWHAWSQGAAYQDAFLDDYAGLIVALSDLFRATQQLEWLNLAVELCETMCARFADPQGGFFMTADDHEQLVVRPKSFQDSSVPSGNALAAEACLTLGRLLARNDWIDLATQTLAAAGSLIEKSPPAFGQSLRVLDQWRREGETWIVVGASGDERQRLHRAMMQHLDPHQTPVLVDAQPPAPPTSVVANLVANRPAVDGQPTLYVCRGSTCQPPIVGTEAIVKRVAGEPLDA